MEQKIRNIFKFYPQIYPKEIHKLIHRLSTGLKVVKGKLNQVVIGFIHRNRLTTTITTVNYYV